MLTLNIPTDWLLQVDPVTAYRTRLDLLGESVDSPNVMNDRSRMLSDPRMQALLDRLTDWPGRVVNSHRSADACFHLLPFLAEAGVDSDDPPMPAILEKVLGTASAEGPFSLTMNIAEHYGGTGKDSAAWALCDAPRTVYALSLLGLGKHPAVVKARRYLTGLSRNNGFPCVVSRELGKFRGPGRKDDPCPYATLVMLELLSVNREPEDLPVILDATGSLLSIWENSRTSHPYMFFMGTDFRKLKAPAIWFDIIHVGEVLSRFPEVTADKRFQSMVDAIAGKAGPDGRFTPESIWKAWNDWDFGQKKEPSGWLTYLAWKVIRRSGG